jgi:DNA-binding Lrp family transcriptional regulator
MAVKAYVLIDTAVGKTRHVVAAVQALDEVNSADTVTGPYDVILVVEAKNLKAIGELVTGKLHPIAGVNRTVTCLAV